MRHKENRHAGRAKRLDPLKRFLLERGSAHRQHFVHEDDVARATYVLAKRGERGTYNIAGDGMLASSEVATLLGARTLSLPTPVVRAINWVGWQLGLRGLVESPPELIDFLRYPWVLDNRRLKDELGFEYSYDSEAALRAYHDT